MTSHVHLVFISLVTHFVQVGTICNNIGKNGSFFFFYCFDSGNQSALNLLPPPLTISNKSIAILNIISIYRSVPVHKQQ